MHPIVSYKHQFQALVTYGGVDANQTLVLYTGGAPGSVATPATVPAGNKVFRVNVVVDFISGAGGVTTDYQWMLVHLRSGQSIDTLFAPTGAPDWTNIGLSTARNQVLKSFTTLGGTNDAGPIRGHLSIKIPKIFQRVREGDTLVLVFSSFVGGPLKMAFRYKSFS